MKKFTTINRLTVLILITFIIMAPDRYDNIKSNAGEITSIVFPYKDGFHMTFQDSTIVYDAYNFPKEISRGSTYYTFHNYKDEVMKIYYYQIKEKDTMKTQTFLVIDDKGMKWWMKDETLDVKEKHKTMAIKLPLAKGMKWTTYVNDIKAKVECFATDTIINTKLGKLHTFGIRFEFSPRKSDEFMIYHKFTEYYEQSIGKVFTKNFNFIIDTKTGQKYRIFEEYSYLTDYEGYQP